MRILNAEQLREADRFTIVNAPVSSIDLMERAAERCFNWILGNVGVQTHILVICGQGNNGGDGLALARMLIIAGYRIETIILQTNDRYSPDCLVNLERLQSLGQSRIAFVSDNTNEPDFSSSHLVIDAIFGTGLRRNNGAFIGRIINRINTSGKPVISIDLPSGIYSDKTSLDAENEIIKANVTLTIQYLKLALLVPENASWYGRVEVLDIGLMNEYFNHTKIESYQTSATIISSIYKPRPAFSHKGTFGHALLIAGSTGKMGAAILAARGFLKSGGGLLTLLVPESGIKVVQSVVPEAMALSRREKSAELEPFKVIAAGPGLGTGAKSQKIMNRLLNENSNQLVLDADAINILAANKDWLSRLPKNSILTPHPGEFRRLAGSWSNDFEKLETQKLFAQKYGVFIILKGKNTSIACPDGHLWFNPTGNPGMAKGGSGDVLTGLIAGLCVSGYTPFESCLLGTWLHGLSGDLAAKYLTEEAMNAGDIIGFLPEAWKKIVADHKRPFNF